MSTVNIIIPIYNQADKIGKCLESIFKQTYRDFSVILVNDGSTDNLTKEILPWQNKIKIINQQNRGASAARNAGAKMATAKFLLFCDADIVMKPKMLEKMVKELDKHAGAAYVYSSFRFGIKSFKLWPFDAVKLKTMPYIHTTSLLRREKFPGFDENLKRFQDWDLWLTLLEKGETGVWLPEILFKIKSGGTMSHWLPSFAYRLFKSNKKVITYNSALRVIKQKHHL